MVRLHSVLLAVFVGFFGLILPLSAMPGGVVAATRITEGDAQAVFRAFTTGGMVIRLQNGLAAEVGAPAAAGARIRPVADGLSFCSLDWHVIGLSILFPASTQQQAGAAFADMHAAFLLDGLPLATTQTAITRDPGFEAQNPGTAPAWADTFGRIMAPTDLSIGRHTLEADVTFPFGPVTFGPVTFYVDPSGAGACT